MKIFFILSFIISSIALQSQAQEVIKIDEAINTAIQNNSNIANLRRSIEINQLSISSARGSLIPDLELSASWTRNNTFSEGIVRFQNGVPIVVPKQDTWINSYNAGLNSQVTLFNGFSNYQRVNLEEQNLVSTRIQIDKEKYDIVYNINQTFFAVLKNEKIVDANEENLADSKRVLESIREFMNVGRRTIADVYRQDVQVAQNELALERSINNLEKSKIDLLLAMNTDLNKNIAASEQSVDIDLTDSELKTILNRYSNSEGLVAGALEKRFDYKASQQQVRINQTQLRIDRGLLYFPTVSAFSSYNLNASQISNITDSRSFNFGVQISYPIFLGNSLSNREQTTEILIKQRQEDIQLLEQQIRSDIKKSYIDLETQYKQIDILNRNIVSAEQDKTLSEESYRVGLGTLLDVQTASTRLNTLRIDLINAYYDFLLAERTIRYNAGELNY